MQDRKDRGFSERTRRKYLPVVCGLIAMLCIGIGLAFAFKSGCAADMKSGIGDVRRAMAFELTSVVLQIIGLVSLAVAGAIIVRERHGLYGVALYAPLQLVLGGLLLWLLALQIETWGVQSCGPARPLTQG